MISAKTWLLLFLVACAMAGNGLIVPILPVYGERFAVSATMVGLLITLFGAARLVTNLPSGFAFMRLGPRPLLLAGNLLLLVGALGAALATSFEALLGWRVVQGVGSGLFLTTTGALIARQSEKATRGRLMAAYQSAVFFGAGIGPVVGGMIAGAMGITAPFWAYGAVSGLALVVSLGYADDPARGRPAPGGERPPLGALFGDRMFAVNLFMSFGNGFTRTAALWQLVPLLAASRFGMGFEAIGLAITVTSVTHFLTLPVSGPLSDRFGWKVLPALSALLLGLALGLLALGPGLPSFWLGVSLAGIAGGLIGPATASALVELSPAPLIGPAMGAQRTAGDLGFVFGPILIGIVLDAGWLDHAGGLLVNAGLLAASGVLWLAVALGRPVPVPAAGELDADGRGA